MFCSVSEDIHILWQQWSHFFKMSNFGSFGAFFAILISKTVLFLHVEFWNFLDNKHTYWSCATKNQNSIFSKNFEVLAKKTLLKFEFCPVYISVTIHCRIAGVFCSVSEDIPIVQRLSHFFKMIDFGLFLANFAILVSNIVFFLILSLTQNSIHLIANCRPGFANNNSTVAI